MFVKKLLTLSSAAFLASAFAAAQDPSTNPQTPEARQAKPADTKAATGELKSGTVKRVDPIAKSATVQVSAGATAGAADAKEQTVYWDESTKIEGGPVKEGDAVSFKAVDKDGKSMATYIRVGKMAKPESK
jgi:Cu/Ag efflux protein CusF